jgi:inhibitor of cysteine peptidase
VLKLKGNITTGYRWSVQDLDEQFLQQQGEEEYESDSKLIGAGGTSTFTFKAKQPGRTTLKLEYSRPFEKDTRRKRLSK